MIVNGKTSRYGSHASMAIDPLLQVICFGWHPEQIALRDQHGVYITSRDRLDTGLADSRRWDRSAAVASAS